MKEWSADMIEPENVRFKRKSQVTIPHDIVEALNLQEGDDLECRLVDGKIVFVPMVSVPRDQAWFWTKEWQEGEREVEEDMKAGRTGGAMTAEETIAWLHRDEE